MLQNTAIIFADDRPLRHQVDAYKRQNEKLKGDLEKCMEAQYRVRELEDEMKERNNALRKLESKNHRLEKLLDKKEPPTDDRVVPNDRIDVLMNDMRLLQEKTRKYKVAGI